MKSIRICGIDPSISSTGVCIVDCNFFQDQRKYLSKLLFKEDIEPTNFEKNFKVIYEEEIKQNKALEKELKKIRKAISSNACGENLMHDSSKEQKLIRSRLVYTVSKVFDVFLMWKPNIIAIEDYSYNSQGSLIQLAELTGVFHSFFEKSKSYLLTNELSPLICKVPIQTIKKVATTYGNANKFQVEEGMKTFGFFDYKKKNDQLDAIAISLTIFYSIYYCLYGLEFQEAKNAKERNKIKSWENSFQKILHRLGTHDNILNFLNKGGIDQ